MKKDRISCYVVEQSCQDADPDTANQRMTPCFACGMPVCKRCSVVRHYIFGAKKSLPKRKICHNCAEQIDGHDDQRMYASYRQAGYSVTKAWIRAMRLYKAKDTYPYPEIESLKEQMARWKCEYEAKRLADMEAVAKQLNNPKYSVSSAILKKRGIV